MRNPISFDQDWHVKSTFSDGTATVADNVRAAEDLGLRSLCVVDRARPTSPWVPDLAQACRAADRKTGLEVSSGVEVDLLNTHGTLDAPPFLSSTDYVFVAADRLPTPEGPVDAEVARDRIEAGELMPARAVEWLVRGYANATRRDAAVVLARPFSILPRLGIDPEAIHPAYVRWLAGAMRSNGAAAEIHESCRAPSLLVLDCFMTAWLPLLPGSGADSPDGIGRFDWAPGLMNGLSSLACAA
jgi:putative hydrolase